MPQPDPDRVYNPFSPHCALHTERVLTAFIRTSHSTVAEYFYQGTPELRR